MKRTNKKKTINLNVQIADIVYVKRVVEFPSVCSNQKCKADLTEPGAMVGAELQAMTRDMALEGEDGDTVTYDEDTASEFSEGDIGWTQVICNRCNQVLAAGNEKELQEKDIENASKWLTAKRCSKCSAILDDPELAADVDEVCLCCADPSALAEAPKAARILAEIRQKEARA